MSYLKENLFTKKDLRFKNGKFKVLCFSDLHGVYNYDIRIKRDIEAIVKGTKPDIVLLLGDVVWKDASENSETLRHFLKGAVSYLEENNIPWAHVFGNHDEEKGFTSNEQIKVYEEFPCCLSKRGPEKVSGIGNFVLPVKKEFSEEIGFNIFMMDSHRGFGDFRKKFSLPDIDYIYKLPDPLFVNQGYDTVYFDQVMWYYQSSLELEEFNKNKIPAIMCMHIAIPEYVAVYKNVQQTAYKGTRREGVGCGPLNTGLFASMLQRGDVKTMVVGHDHINDFEGNLWGINLTFDGGMNYDCYCDDDLRGGRIIEIDESDPFNQKTYMVYSKDYVENYPGECKRIFDET